MATQRLAERITIDPETIDPADIERAGHAIASGKLVAIPTETVYGLGCNALDVNAVRSVFAAKKRPFSDPLIVHVDGPDMLEGIVSAPIPPVTTALVENSGLARSRS